MTCIVGIEHEGAVWVGGDACAIADDRDFCLSSSPKVFIKGRMIFGFSGGFREHHVLQYRLQIPEHPTGMACEEYLCTLFVDAVRDSCRSAGIMIVREGVEQLNDAAVIIGYMGKLRVLESTFGLVHNIRGYEAIGCGSKYARGALCVTRSGGLAPTVRIQQALEAAEEHNAGVMGPFTILGVR